jgi:peptidyl-dipeptidase A
MQTKTLSSLMTLFVLQGCSSSLKAPGSTATDPSPTRASPEQAKDFATRVSGELKEKWTQASYADWVMNTHITDDTEYLATKAMEDVLGYSARTIKESARFNGLELDHDTKRSLHLLKVSSPMVAPNDAKKQKRMAEIAAKLTSIYGKGKACEKNKRGEEVCRDLEKLSSVIASSKDYDELLKAWTDWRTISPPMRPLYEEFVELSNQGTREIGFKDTGDLWRAGYDMNAQDFEKETDRLWDQVKPLYEQLHCYVRTQLSKTYGADKVSKSGPIPAHLLGNMWAQEWSNVYEQVKPYATKSSIDVTKALNDKKYDAHKMVKLSEKFFTSLGLNALPESFWKNSMFLKPEGREVVCHASAWDVNFAGDLRIKMCIKVDEEDLITIHHELGHIYYYMYYNTKPFLFQNGAHDGFHEAIGDALALSVTPGYLKNAGILDAAPENEKELINYQLKKALDKVAFLPFGKLIDQWRWDVFSKKVAAKDYNTAWWKLREKYQGIRPAVQRTEESFDPGAKYHIPTNVPYTRYFLAHILQFQFHKAMCDAAGHTGPLHQCSIYGNLEAGKKLQAMLELGASRPWPEALEKLTGGRQMDARALLDYFAPLSAWLTKQNKKQSCGWQ